MVFASSVRRVFGSFSAMSFQRPSSSARGRPSLASLIAFQRTFAAISAAIASR
jgi:hypothetical protein